MAGFTDRALLVAIGPDGKVMPVKADELGNLVVVGGGVTSGTQVQIVDGVDTAIKATIGMGGRLLVTTQHVQPLTDAQLRAARVAVDTGLTELALPAAQVTDLKTVTVANPTANPETGLAKDATLAAINANTDAVESLLTFIRDEQMRRTDPLAAGVNTIGKVQLDQAATHFITSSGSLKMAHGRFFIGGKAVVVGGLASTDRPVFRLLNPATSTKLVYITKITIYSTIAQQVKYNEDGTIIVDGTIVPHNLNRALATPPAAVAELTHGKSGITGGTDWPNESRVDPVAPLTLDFSQAPIPLGPGKAFLARGSTGESQTFTVNAFWFEDPL